MPKTFNSVEEMWEHFESQRSKLDKFFDPIRCKIEDIKSRIRLWFERPTTVKPKWLGHYHMDQGDLLPHLIFATLDNFITHEWSEDKYKDPNETDPDLQATLKQWEDAWKELKGHHNWFHQTFLPIYKNDMNFFPDNLEEIKKSDKEKYFSILRDATDRELACEAELTKRAMRVVELRDYMWT